MLPLADSMPVERRRAATSRCHPARVGATVLPVDPSELCVADNWPPKHHAEDPRARSFWKPFIITEHTMIIASTPAPEEPIIRSADEQILLFNGSLEPERR